MRLPNFDYLEPATLEEVLSILGDLQGEARVLAGGHGPVTAYEIRTRSSFYPRQS